MRKSSLSIVMLVCLLAAVALAGHSREGRDR